jgi:putative endonuclease
VGSNPYAVYLLISLENEFRYVGFCQDVGKRLNQHNRGQTRSTKPYAPFRVIVLRSVPTRELARRSERYFKSGHGRAQIDRLLAIEIKREDRIENAELEGFIGNPFTLENGAQER